ANNILLEGSYLRAVHGTLNLTATTGNITATALRASKTEAGFLNHYWDYVQLLGGRGVNVRAAGHIDMDGVFVHSHEGVNIQSGGDTNIAGKHGRWTEDNRSTGGWFRDEVILWPSAIKGNTGVNIGAQGGNLTLNATSINAASGKASLQASGHIKLEAAQKHRLHRSRSERSYETCIWVFCNDVDETTHRHHEYLTNSPVTVTAQDIEVKAGNDLTTYGTKFHASRNLTLQAGDGIRYYAVWDQQYISDTTYQEQSFLGWTWDRSTTINSTQLLAGQPTQLQSQNDILSNSGGNQLLQGTQVRYGG
ncbi:hemagglutinin repeat-containing protein, partial [Verminephrobacter aporrectodeae]